MRGSSKAFQYYVMFSYFPKSLGSLTAMYFGIVVIYAVIAYLTSGKPIIIATYFLISFVYVLSIRSAIVFFDTKRSIGLALAGLVMGLPAEIVGDALRTYGLSFAILPYLTTLVAKGILKNAKRFTLCILVAALSQALFYFFNMCHALGLVIRQAMVATSSLAALDTLSKLRRIDVGNGVDVLSLANAWAKYILMRDSSDLEQLFFRCGIRKRIITKFIRIDCANNARIILLVPGVHFGPFRELGSATLPHILDEELGRRGYEVLVLHGAGSHELDVVTAEETKLFVRRLMSLMDVENNYDNVEMFEFFRVHDGVREALVIPSDRTYLVAISSPLTGGDDLPKEVEELAEELGKKYLGVDVIVVDCHNVEGPRELNPKTFVPLLRQALSTTSRICSDFEASIAVEEVKGHVKGLCSPKIKVLAISCNGKKLGIVYLFGNNAMMGVRDSLRRQLIELGFDDAEVVTADDHLCTATSFDAPYYAVELSRELVQAVRNASLRALKTLSLAKARYGSAALDTMVLGENAFKLLGIAENVGSLILKSIKLWFVLFNVVGILYAILRVVHLL